MYKMQQWAGMVGIYEGTEDEEYGKMKDVAKNLKEACKQMRAKIEDVAEGSDELVGNMKELANSILHKYLLNKQTTGLAPPNTALVAVARDLGGMEFGENVFREALMGCGGLIDSFVVEMKQLEDYRETRRKKKEVYDWCKYELRIKAEDLTRKEKPFQESQSYQKKLASFNEADSQYQEANTATKRHMSHSISRRDALLAELIQSYLKGCSTYFLTLHRKFAELHDMTVARVSPVPSPRKRHSVGGFDGSGDTSPKILYKEEDEEEEEENSPPREPTGEVLFS